MPQGSDLSKSIRTMRKDIDRARRGGPDEEYVSPVPQNINKGAAAPVLQVDLTNPRPKPAVKPGDSFVKPTQPSPVSTQGIQMQKFAEEKLAGAKTGGEQTFQRASLSFLHDAPRG